MYLKVILGHDKCNALVIRFNNVVKDYQRSNKYSGMNKRYCLQRLTMVRRKVFWSIGRMLSMYNLWNALNARAHRRIRLKLNSKLDGEHLEPYTQIHSTSPLLFRVCCAYICTYTYYRVCICVLDSIKSTESNSVQERDVCLPSGFEFETNEKRHILFH